MHGRGAATWLGLGLSGSDLGELGLVNLELLFVLFLLLGLVGLLLSLRANLSQFLVVELVVSLQLVGATARAEKSSEEENSEEEAADGVPG